jgi:hypothetical protein
MASMSQCSGVAVIKGNDPRGLLTRSSATTTAKAEDVLLIRLPKVHQTNRSP